MNEVGVVDGGSTSEVLAINVLLAAAGKSSTGDEVLAGVVATTTA